MVRRTALALGFVVLGGGCGTVNNLVGYKPSEGTPERPPRQVYGGVRGEWAELRATRFDDVYCINLYFLPFFALDLPLSAIGDTLTLPVTLGSELARAVNRYYFPVPPEQPNPPADP